MYVTISRAQAWVTVPRCVICEHCGTEYFYDLTIVGEASGQIGAEYDLAKQLARTDLSDPVPCPKCLKFQQHMARAAGESRNAWIVIPMTMTGCGGILAVLTALVVLPRWSERAPVIAGAVLSVFATVGLFVWFNKRSGSYDPNTQAESRRAKLAKRRAMTREQFRERQARTMAKEFRDHQKKPPREQEAQPFAVECWVTEAEIAAEGRFMIELPNGWQAYRKLDDTMDTHTIYEFATVDGLGLPFAGERQPFVARVCIFNRNPTLS